MKPSDSQPAAKTTTNLKVLEWYKFARQKLSDISDVPDLEARLIISKGLSVSTGWHLGHPEDRLTQEQRDSIDHLLSRRLVGEPLPYLMGHWEFYGLDFDITPNVLIPRPETELLVETALSWLDEKSDRRHVLDVGTGSGCIAISLACFRPELLITATDISPEALMVAQKNGEKFGINERINWIQSDLATKVTERFDLVCANLPYIPTGPLSALDVVRFEPRLALDGGLDGLDLIQRLVGDLSWLIKPGGLGLLEIESTQGAQAFELGKRGFPEANVEIQKDLAGNDRLLKIAL